MDAVSNWLPSVLNIVHPRPTDWNTIIKLIGNALVLQKKLESPLAFVSFQEWFSILEAHAQSSNQADEVKIVCVFFSLSIYVISHCVFFFSACY